MTRLPGSSLRWLTLAVLLPLLVLGVLAWLGTRAQVKAAWSLAREEAKVSANFAEESISRALAAAVETAPLFPDPPQPGVASAADVVLDGSDLAALKNLRDDPAAGLSPGGLPRRVLAGFRVFEQTHHWLNLGTELNELRVEFRFRRRNARKKVDSSARRDRNARRPPVGDT